MKTFLACFKCATALQCVCAHDMQQMNYCKKTINFNVIFLSILRKLASELLKVVTIETVPVTHSELVVDQVNMIQSLRTLPYRV